MSQKAIFKTLIKWILAAITLFIVLTLSQNMTSEKEYHRCMHISRLICKNKLDLVKSDKICKLYSNHVNTKFVLSRSLICKK